MTFHLTCDFKSLNCPMKELLHFFITFSYNFIESLKSVKKPITRQLQDNLSRPSISQTINNKQRSDIRFQEGVATNPLPPPPWSDMLAEMA